MPPFPRSASQEEFEHGPITSTIASTRCQKHNVPPGRWGRLPSVRQPRSSWLFEPLGRTPPPGCDPTGGQRMATHPGECPRQHVGDTTPHRYRGNQQSGNHACRPAACRVMALCSPCPKTFGPGSQASGISRRSTSAGPLHLGRHLTPGTTDAGRSSCCRIW